MAKDKKIQFQDLVKKPVAALQHEVLELKDKLWEIQKNLAQGKVKNIREVRSTKKHIAQILTAIKSQRTL